MITRALFLLLIPLAFTVPANAQYLYLESNGDGVHTTADKLHPSHPTTVDVWLDTAHNRDGSPTVCKTNPSVSLDIFSYVVNLAASAGTVSYSAYTNRAPGMVSISPGSANSTQFTTGAWAGSAQSSLPPGRYRLGTLTITVQSGFPDVEIVPNIAISTDGTLFGSTCDEHADQTNSIVLGLDWTDVDGLARPGAR